MDTGSMMCNMSACVCDYGVWVLVWCWVYLLQFKPPDAVDKSQSTLLLQKTQENVDVHIHLQAKRQDFFDRMQKVQEREKELQLKV